MSESSTQKHHNPGPPWGFRVIHFWDRILPSPLNLWIRDLCTWVAMFAMAKQRRHSREYMSAVLGKPAKLTDCFIQFKGFVYYLIDRVNSAFDQAVHFKWADGKGEHFEELTQYDGPVLMGTFHVGYSDLMGFFTRRLNAKIHMLRLKLDNSEDTERLEALAGDYLKIIWVNDVQDTIYAIKEVINNGGSVAMQCDRVQHASKLRYFDFLGAKRAFPFTIYSLSLLFNVPVLFVIAGTKDTEDGIVPVYSSTIYRPDAESKNANLEKAHEHFQSVLHDLEANLKKNPGMWFNFEPLNPVEKS